MMNSFTTKLEHLIGKKVVVERPGKQSVVGYLNLTGNGLNYACWDTGSTVMFDDNDIDHTEVNFIFLKP